MSNITPFFNQNFNFAVRAVDIDGEVYLVGKDVALALGYADTVNAIKQHCRGVAKHHPIPDSLGRVQETRILSEGDMYRLIVNSHLPTAEKFEAWVFDEVLPTIRKTGRYSAPMSPAELLVAQAQALLQQERRLSQAEQAVVEVRQQVGQLAETRVWDHCPQNCEPITKIRARMNKRYGLPAWVVDMVMRELPLSLKVHGMVRNNHESAEGSHYEVWAVADVTRVFKQFVSECRQETAWFATHPMIPERFKLRQVEGEAA
ncbi:Bro-N domain-containing protein [Achromobacter sp.]|uniref:BRO-N domain-containing protein n=1 Tax=Achromobacter sp. TaxID=134375 RepID=UPI0028A96D9A|nr:Bro-N domain-containing protein [Achromobacter sp.]